MELLKIIFLDQVNFLLLQKSEKFSFKKIFQAFENFF